MAYSLNTLSGFEAFLSAQGFDSKSTNEIVNYLQSLGYTTQVALDIETGKSPPTPPFDPNAQVDVATDSRVTFSPTGAAAVLLDIADAHITVTGSSNVAVSASAGNNVIDLDSSTGDDDVFLGKGNNTVTTGFGSETVIGGTGNETYREVAGSADDTFYAGTGTNKYVDNSSSSNAFLGGGLKGNDKISIHNTGHGTDTIVLGDGHNTVGAGAATDNLLIEQSGRGRDSITLGDGDNTVGAGSSTGDLFIRQGGTGSATVTLGSGRDTVDLATDKGNGVAGVVDSVTGGSGPDTVDFVGASLSSAHLYFTGTGAIVTFGGQLIPNSSGTGYIPDPHHPPVQTVSVTNSPGSDVTLEFTDGHLKA
jgi:Ca2+-binding RTX toxin-like protein